jgi:hypothetical protein
MKEVTKASRRYRINSHQKSIRSNGDNVVIRYSKPTNKNDLKRWGKELQITGENFTIKLNGHAIRSIKAVLEKAGELD